MEVIALPTQPFSVFQLQELERTGQLRDFKDCINYIYTYFFEIKKGNYYFYDVDKHSFQLYKYQEFESEKLQTI